MKCTRTRKHLKQQQKETIAILHQRRNFNEKVKSSLWEFNAHIYLYYTVLRKLGSTRGIQFCWDHTESSSYLIFLELRLEKNLLVQSDFFSFTQNVKKNTKMTLEFS